MEGKIIKKILAAIIAIIIMSTDFVVLGTSLKSYAAETSNTTNNKNIEFSAYFKDEKGEKVEELQTSIKKENIRLYAEIKVKNDGYLSEGKIELENSNFKIKNNKISEGIANISENTVTLKQINAGETAEIELEIEPAIGDKLTEEMLIKASDVKLTGKYMETSYKGLSIKAERQVTLNVQADKNAKAELKTEIITNKIFSMNGEDKRVVQLLVQSRLSDNEYPIKETQINVDIPSLSEKEPEKIEVVSLGTNATNGKRVITDEEWKKEEGQVKIAIKNEESTIEWNKNTYDEMVVTFIYDKSVEANKLEINANSEITVHNNGTKYTAKYTKGIENSEPNGVISTESSINAEGIYKGQIASNISAKYSTKTRAKITNTEIPGKITIKEIADVLETEDSELTINTKYISTKINKERMTEIFGQEGSITIKGGTTTVTINKDTETDENGNIVIKYENPVSEIEITTSEAKQGGVLEIENEKEIAENTYKIAELNNVKTLKTKNTIKGTGVENSSESRIEVKDTVSKAEFTVNKDTLSTMTTNKNVILGVKLKTNGVQYDLYKNPTIKIQLPTEVENVVINGVKPLYAEEFKVSSKYDNTNKTIEMKLIGEQTSHAETEATQLYLQLDLDITLSKLASSKTEKITMTYINENATQYDNGTEGKGIIEKEIVISAPSGLITMHNSNTYNIEGIKGISEAKQLIQVENKDAGKEVNFNIAIINNIGQDAKNVKIYGKLPTKGNKITGEEKTNTLETTLKNIVALNATIYYSENANATTDVENTTNGWTTTIMPNAKVYLIVLGELKKENNYTASYNIQMPTPIQKDVTSYTEYEVTYDLETEKNIKTKSVAIGFATPTEIKLEAGISAEVGNDRINNGDTIKAGEVIRYTMTVKNNGAQKLENIELKSSIPEGTVYVTPEANYQHTGTTYYTENADISEIKEIIESLEAGKSYTKTYEVRAKSDITAEKQISNKAIATCEGASIESTELITKIEPSNIRVTIKKLVEESETLISGGTMEYMVIVDNLSDQEERDLQLQMIGNNFKLTCLSDGEDLYLINDEIPEIINIEKIPAKGNVWFKLEGETIDGAENVVEMAVVEDSHGNKYRSNLLGFVLQKVDAKVSLSSPQDKNYIKEGDTVEYNIKVENTAGLNESIMIIDNIPQYLEVKEIQENGEIQLQTTDKTNEDTYVQKISNDITYPVNVNANGSVMIKIITTLKYIPDDMDAKTITNKAEAKVYGITRATSGEVTHILKLTSENIKNLINGKAWLDENINGAKDTDEAPIQGIKVRIYDVSTSDYLKDSNGTVIETVTDANGEYGFTKIPNGQYIVLFEYDMDKYEPTNYMEDEVDDSINSKVVLNDITINGENKTYAVTDTINLEDNISNINIGLKEKLDFDLQLDKYITKITVQNDNGTKTYNYDNATFAKVEINRRHVEDTIVLLEYTIKVKNNGKIPGYAESIVDYVSNDLEFNSELNPDWYYMDDELYTDVFSDEVINPGEEKEIKLVLTKTMTNDNTGVVNNRAEIAEDYNEYGNEDINSTPNNNMPGENDMGSADVIIGIATGGTIVAYIMLVIANIALIGVAIKLIKKME